MNRSSTVSTIWAAPAPIEPDRVPPATGGSHAAGLALDLWVTTSLVLAVVVVVLFVLLALTWTGHRSNRPPCS